MERKTIGLGGDELTALNIAKALDDNITDSVRRGEPVDIENLKLLAKGIMDQEKLNRSPSLAVTELVTAVAAAAAVPPKPPVLPVAMAPPV